MKLASWHRVPILEIALQFSSKKNSYLFEILASDVIAKDALVESVTTFLADGPKEAHTPADCSVLLLRVAPPFLDPTEAQ